MRGCPCSTLVSRNSNQVNETQRQEQNKQSYLPIPRDTSSSWRECLRLFCQAISKCIFKWKEEKHTAKGNTCSHSLQRCQFESDLTWKLLFSLFNFYCPRNCLSPILHAFILSHLYILKKEGNVGGKGSRTELDSATLEKWEFPTLGTPSQAKLGFVDLMLKRISRVAQRRVVW